MQRQRCIRIYGPMFDYLRHNETSPFKNSLVELSLNPDRWMHIVSWHFGFSLAETEEYAAETKKMARAHGTLAKSEARKSLGERIEESLKHGSGWLHTFVKKREAGLCPHQNCKELHNEPH